MTRILSAAAVLVLLSIVANVPARAQEVSVDVTLPSYDYVNLTDLVDIDYTTGDYHVRNSFQDFMVRIVDPSGADRKVYARVAVTIDLANECDMSGPEVVTVVQSDVFSIVGGERTLTSFDFTDDQSPIGGESFDNEDLVGCLEDLVQDNMRTTAPVGTYGAILRIYDGSGYEEGEQPEWSGDDLSMSGCDGGSFLACDVATLTVHYTSREEVVMDLLFPGDEEVTVNANPTFSWSAGVDDVTLEVYHVPEGEVPGSAVEVQSNLMARVPLPGQSAWTYDESFTGTDRPIRSLRAGERYAWRVVGSLYSTSGAEAKSSDLFTFVVPEVGAAGFAGAMPGQQTLRKALSTVVQGGTATGDLTRLRELHLNLNVDLVLFDNRTITSSELAALIDRLTSGSNKRSLTVRVEDL